MKPAPSSFACSTMIRRTTTSFMDSLAADANDARPGTITAREGQIIDL